MSKLDLRGLIPAVFTPFSDPDPVDLNLRVVPHYLQKLIEGGTIGAFIGGTTGEGFQVTCEERMVIARAWNDARKSNSDADNFRLILHVGSLPVQNSFSLASDAASLEMDAIAFMSPVVHGPRNEEETVQLCREVAQRSALPFYYYYFPSLTGVTLNMCQFFSRAKKLVPNFAGVKYTHNDLQEFAELILSFGDDFDFLWGTDELMAAAIAYSGAMGFVGSSYNAIPRLYQKVIGGAASGSRSAQRSANSFIKALSETGPGYLPSLKAFMEHLGIDCGPVRRPLRTPNDAQEGMLIHAIGELKIPQDEFVNALDGKQ